MADNLKFKLIEAPADIEAAIASIATRGKKWERDVQVAALSAMAHHAAHGDTTLINRLIDAMPASARKKALLAYIEWHGKVVWDSSDKKMKHAKGKSFKHAEADAVLWTDFKPAPVYKPIDDPSARIASLISKFEEDVKEMGEYSMVTPEMITRLQEVERTFAR